MHVPKDTKKLQDRRELNCSVRIINLNSFVKKPELVRAKSAASAKVFLTFVKHFLNFVILLTINFESRRNGNAINILFVCFKMTYVRESIDDIKCNDGN